MIEKKRNTRTKGAKIDPVQIGFYDILKGYKSSFYIPVKVIDLDSLVDGVSLQFNWNGVPNPHEYKVAISLICSHTENDKHIFECVTEKVYPMSITLGLKFEDAKRSIYEHALSHMKFDKENTTCCEFCLKLTIVDFSGLKKEVPSTNIRFKCIATPQMKKSAKSKASQSPIRIDDQEAHDDEEIDDPFNQAEDKFESLEAMIENHSSPIAPDQTEPPQQPEPQVSNNYGDEDDIANVFVQSAKKFKIEYDKLVLKCSDQEEKIKFQQEKIESLSIELTRARQMVSVIDQAMEQYKLRKEGGNQK